MLRGKKPDPVEKRLKLFMYGPAGVGKSTAAIQFPNSYIIDCERGTDNYDKLIAASGSAVFQTVSIDEMVQEVRSLLTEKHDFRTLVIDPITPVYNDLLEKSELKVGSEFGRHYGEANKAMKRLANLVMALDMNVVITSHAKNLMGANMAVLGQTFDAWKGIDYWFDLVVELQKRGKKRMGVVKKSRIAGFPDDESFEWNYDEIKKRYGAELLERVAVASDLATTDQIGELAELIRAHRVPVATVDKWYAKAGVDSFEDMPAETIIKCIEYVKARASAPNHVVPA